MNGSFDLPYFSALWGVSAKDKQKKLKLEISVIF